MRLPAGDDVADEQELVRFLPLAYDELRALAANLLRGRRRVDVMRPTSQVHEAWLPQAVARFTGRIAPVCATALAAGP